MYDSISESKYKPTPRTKYGKHIGYLYSYRVTTVALYATIVCMDPFLSVYYAHVSKYYHWIWYVWVCVFIYYIYIPRYVLCARVQWCKSWRQNGWRASIIAKMAIGRRPVDLQWFTVYSVILYAVGCWTLGDAYEIPPKAHDTMRSTAVDVYNKSTNAFLFYSTILKRRPFLKSCGIAQHGSVFAVSIMPDIPIILSHGVHIIISYIITIWSVHTIVYGRIRTDELLILLL